MISRYAFVAAVLGACVAAWSRTTLKSHAVPRNLGLFRQNFKVEWSVLYSSTKSSTTDADFTPTNFHPNKEVTTCTHCAATFATRNALFRHIRNDPICGSLASSGRVELTRQSIALLFGYSHSFSDGSISYSSATQAGKVLQQTILESLKEISIDIFNVTEGIELISLTQSSIAKLRHPALSQDYDSGSCGDVLVANVFAPKLMNVELWTDVLERIRDRIADLDLKVFACKLLETGIVLHAEQSCTQRVYHYLLPISWLPDADELHRWWKTGEDNVLPGQKMKKSESPPHSLRRFKVALRSAECAKIEVEKIRADVHRTLRIAAGRYGALGTKERRPWHNYADPELRGDASPNTEPVWRVVDRARIVDYLDTPDGDVVLVLEIKGDAFLRQQVRRIVASVVAISHGWLPENFLEVSTRADVVLETPLAPSGRLYNAGTRFHFEEIRTKGLSFFDSDVYGDTIGDSQTLNGIEWIQELLLKEVSHPESRLAEKSWLEDLQNVAAPNIETQLARLHDDPVASTSESVLQTTCPDAYTTVLNGLRDIIAEGQWPETSAARASVIRNVEKSGNIQENGSFTVVNRNIGQHFDSQPLGNELFPELTDAIFELEQVLSQQARDKVTVETLEHDVLTGRPSSSHCAVNYNAGFTPHVDSGTGSGQSLSMIVGLGDYEFGELFVEGKMFDIKYKPIEFDGWKLRHWTNRFQGERFSLVWFTPEVKSRK